MKLNYEIVDCETWISPADKAVLYTALTTIEKLNDDLEECGIYDKTMYIEFDRYNLRYMIMNKKYDCQISLPTIDPERLIEDINVLKNYIWV